MKKCLVLSVILLNKLNNILLRASIKPLYLSFSGMAMICYVYNINFILSKGATTVRLKAPAMNPENMCNQNVPRLFSSLYILILIKLIIFNII